MPLPRRDKLIIPPCLHDLLQAWKNEKVLTLTHLLPQTFMHSWGYAVMLNTMMCKPVIRLGYCIPLLLEDFYTQVALRLWRIMLKCTSDPFNKIGFLGARMRPSMFMWKHAFYFIWCILLKDWRRGRLYPTISCVWPQKWHMKDIINLKCAW